MEETISSSFGETAEEANNNPIEAVLLYSEEINDLKIREQIFSSNTKFHKIKQTTHYNLAVSQVFSIFPGPRPQVIYHRIQHF